MGRPRLPARLRLRGDDKAWIIQDGGKEKRTGVYGKNNLAEAEEILAQYITNKNLSDNRMVQPDEITVGEVLARYAKERQKIVDAPKMLLFHIKTLSSFWADKTVAEVNNELGEEYIEKRGVASSTVRREIGVLNAALRFARDTHRIAYAPTLRLPKPGVPRDRWLTKEEEDCLLQHAAPHIQRFIKIAVKTGRRRQAILDLKWSPSLYNGWVDLERGRIHFLGRGQEENSKRRGVVTIPKTLLEDMKTWEQDCAWVISYDGQRVKDIKKGFNMAVKRAGLGKDVTPHTLKHTAVTRAFMEGMSMDDAVGFFETSRRTIENVYRSYSPDALKRAAEIMDRT